VIGWLVMDTGAAGNECAGTFFPFLSFFFQTGWYGLYVRVKCTIGRCRSFFFKGECWYESASVIGAIVMEVDLCAAPWC